MRRSGGPGVNVLVRWTQIDLLATEFKRGPGMRAEILAVHAEHSLVPGGCDIDVRDVEDDVVDAVYGESHRVEAPSGCAEEALADFHSGAYR
jgi:hypothetical protein